MLDPRCSSHRLRSNLAAAGWLTAIAAGSAIAQNPSGDSSVPKTPTQCINQMVHPAQSKVYQWESDTNSKLADGVPWETVRRMVDTAQQNAANRCLALLKVDKTPNDELKSLAELYLWAGKIDKAKSVVKRRVALAQSPQEKTKVLLESFRSFSLGSAPPLVRLANRRAYLDQLNALGDVALLERIQAHLEIYDTWAKEPACRDKADLAAALTLYRRVPDTAVKRKEASRLGGLFVSLSVRALQDVDLEYADHIADSGLAVLADLTDTAKLFQLPGYGTLGLKGAPISSDNWLNAPAGFTAYQPGNGRVTLVELTSYG